MLGGAAGYGGGVLGDGNSLLNVGGALSSLSNLLPTFPSCAVPPFSAPFSGPFGMRPNANERPGDAEVPADASPIEGGALSTSRAANSTANNSKLVRTPG